jgi:hypothetical protein
VYRYDDYDADAPLARRVVRAQIRSLRAWVEGRLELQPPGR